MDDEKKFIYTTSFNSIMKKLIKFSCSKSFALKTNRIKERVSLLIDNAPLTVLEQAGPYILKYAKNIKNRDGEFFMNADFSENYSNDENKKDIVTVINRIRKIYKKCSTKEKEYICDLCDDLLITYCKYLSHQRGIAKK